MTDVMSLVPVRQGHFLLESGHHGRLWLDLELLLARPRVVRQLARSLALRVAEAKPDAVCGPLVEGAFVALMVAEELDLPLTYTVPRRDRAAGTLFPVRYDLPSAQMFLMAGKRVAVVNDVINAGSAVRGTLEAIRVAGGQVVTVASLMVLGAAAQQLADEHGVTLMALQAVPNPTWTPAACPLCAAGQALSDLGC